MPKPNWLESPGDVYLAIEELTDGVADAPPSSRDEPPLTFYILAEAIAAVYHLSNKYGHTVEDVIRDGQLLYEAQVRRELASCDAQLMEGSD